MGQDKANVRNDICSVKDIEIDKGTLKQNPLMESYGRECWGEFDSSIHVSKLVAIGTPLTIVGSSA